MALIGEKLASDKTLDKALCICLGRWPKETCTKGFTYEGPSRGVVTAATSLDFGQELSSLFCGDTSLKDSSSTFLVELSVMDLVGFRAPNNAASLILVRWELPPIKVGQDRFGPGGNYCHY